MVIRLVIDYGELVKVALKWGGWDEWVGGLRGMGTAGFCGPCVCLDVFLLLYWWVFVSGAGVVCSWYSKLVSRW
jgi:hypothetical protein